MFGLLPGSTVLSDTDNDIQTIVTQVETLAVTLGAVTDEGEGIVLEVLLQARSVLGLDVFRQMMLTRSFSRGQSSRSEHSQSAVGS